MVAIDELSELFYNLLSYEFRTTIVPTVFTEEHNQIMLFVRYAGDTVYVIGLKDIKGCLMYSKKGAVTVRALSRVI